MEDKYPQVNGQTGPVLSHNVCRLIQVPRLYKVYKVNGSIRTFEDIINTDSTVRIFYRGSMIALALINVQIVFQIVCLQ